MASAFISVSVALKHVVSIFVASWFSEFTFLTFPPDTHLTIDTNRMVEQLVSCSPADQRWKDCEGKGRGNYEWEG